MCSYPVFLVANLNPVVVGDDPLVKGQDCLVYSLQPSNLYKHSEGPGFIMKTVSEGPGLSGPLPSTIQPLKKLSEWPVIVKKNT